jgi:cobalt-zinc-cadmium efflux system protein
VLHHKTTELRQAESYMAHGHSHHDHHQHEVTDLDGKNIVFAFWINTAFVVIELAGGFFTNSVAILSDALHDLGDSLSLGLTYYFHKKSKKNRDASFPYGYRRFSLLGAFINGTILIVSSAFIIQESITRLWQPEQPDAKGMAVLAVIGIVANGIAMLRLRKGNSLNEKAVSLHFLEDVLGWIAVLIGSIVMIFATVPVLDPVLSLIISAIVLYHVYQTLKATFRIFLQASPETVDQDKIRESLLSISSIKNIHDVRSWSLDGRYNIITLHVVVADNKTARELEAIKAEVRHRLQHLNIQHITIEVELDSSACDARNQ